MIKFSKWVLFFVCSVLAFSCSTSKEITLSNDKVKLQTEASTSNGVIDNERVHTISFASLVETTNQLDFKETENPPLFKAIPDSVLAYLPTVAEQVPSLEEQETNVNADPPVLSDRELNFYGRTSLTLGIIALFTLITIYGALVCGILAIVYANKSRRKGEPNRGYRRAGMTLGIASLALLPFVWLTLLFLALTV